MFSLSNFPFFFVKKTNKAENEELWDKKISIVFYLQSYKFLSIAHTF